MGYDKYCTHIEKKLPPKGARNLAGSTNIENIPEFFKPSTEVQLQSLEKKLLGYGLPKYMVDLVILRIGEGYTLQRIVDEQNWTSIGAANHHYQRALKILRKVGFK